nr:hypothetical protein [Tanacetum cinerariifolium]
VNIPRSDEDRLELLELMVFLLLSDEKDRVKFWTSIAVKKVNDVTRLKALVDKRKVIITEATIREALRLDDAEGVECLNNEEIFAELARMGYEKPSTKLTFYKVAESADEVHDEGVPAAGIVAEGDDKIAQALEITKLKQKVKKLEKRNKLKRGIIANIDADKDVVLEVAKDVAVEKYADIDESMDIQERTTESQAQIYQIDLEHANKIITEVVTAASITITAATTAAAPTLTAAPSRRAKGVVIRDPKESATPSTIIHSKAKSKDKGKGILVEEPKPLKKQAQIKQDEKYARELEAELTKTIDWDEVIDHVQRKQKEDKSIKIFQALKRKPQTEAKARKNMMIYLKNVAGFKMDYFKGMFYDDIRPIFKKHFDSNVAFLQKTKEQMDEEDSRALKRLNESQEEKATKRQKLDEEVEELKRHLSIVPNDEYDVYTEATPLARKVTVVDYKIYNENNKSYYKIKRADGSHQLYLSFRSLLKNFDREDLEAL